MSKYYNFVKISNINYNKDFRFKNIINNHNKI